MKKNKIVVIAEVGVNHNGSVRIAKKLINVAKKSGAQYVKFQSFSTKNLVKKNTQTANYQKKKFKENKSI